MKQMKTIYILGMVLLTVFGIYYYKDIITGNYPKKVSEKSISNNQHNLSKRAFHIEGMYCDACKGKIEKAVSSINGVVKVSINEKSNEMIVNYTKNQENIKETLTKVKNLGYKIGLKSKSGKLQVLDYKIKIK